MMRRIALTAAITLVAASGAFLAPDGPLAASSSSAADEVSRATAPAPTPADGDVVVRQVAAGFTHTCAVVSDGSVRCWGSNRWGEVGDNTRILREQPVVVRLVNGEPLGEVVQVDARGWFRRGHSCAVQSNGVARCWGNNEGGQLGNGGTTAKDHPVLVRRVGGEPLRAVTRVATGGRHTCALIEDGTIRCWGVNVAGTLGNGNHQLKRHPVTVRLSGGGPLTGATQITAGSDFSCALLDNGTVRCWGWNEHGQLGDGTKTDSTRPVVVRLADGSPLDGVVQITAGEVHTCALLQNDTARCWGWNWAGQLGDGTTHGQRTPVAVRRADGAQLDGIVGITAGGSHTCALLDDDTMRCWGYNEEGELGDGTTTDSLHPIAVLTEPGTALDGGAAIDGGWLHTCAALEDGTARCWGYNQYGEIGDGTHTDRLFPVEPIGL